MTDAPELKPCPFCGGEANYHPDHTTERLDTVYCSRCDVSVSDFNIDGPQGSCIAGWNTRADLPPKVKPLEWELTHTKGGMRTYVAPSPHAPSYVQSKGWAFEVRETEANFWHVQTDDGLKKHDGDWESAKAWVQGIHNTAVLSCLVGGE